MEQITVDVRVKGNGYTFNVLQEREGFCLMDLNKIHEATMWSISTVNEWWRKNCKSPKTKKWKEEYAFIQHLVEAAKSVKKPYYISEKKWFDRKINSRMATVEEYYIYLAYMASQGWFKLNELLSDQGGTNHWYVMGFNGVVIMGNTSSVAIEEIVDKDFVAPIGVLITLPT